MLGLALSVENSEEAKSFYLFVWLVFQPELAAFTFFWPFSGQGLGLVSHNLAQTRLMEGILVKRSAAGRCHVFLLCQSWVLNKTWCSHDMWYSDRSYFFCLQITPPNLRTLPSVSLSTPKIKSPFCMKPGSAGSWKGWSCMCCGFSQPRGREFFREDLGSLSWSAMSLRIAAGV